MQKWNAVLFDLDGTLTDSAPSILECFEFTLAQYNLHEEHSKMRRFLGPPLRVTFAELLPEKDVEDAVEVYRRHYAEVSAAKTTVYPGVREMLVSLKSAGFTVCVATSKALSAARQVMDQLDLTKYFDYIGGASEDSSMDTKAAVIRHVLSRPCMQGKYAVMIGDRRNDMEGAAECGLPAVGVRYGYAEQGELEPFSPEYIAPTADALCRWLLERKEVSGERNGML